MGKNLADLITGGPKEGQRGTAPDGTEFIFQNGRPVPVNSTAKDMRLSGGQGLWNAVKTTVGQTGDFRDLGHTLTQAIATKLMGPERGADTAKAYDTAIGLAGGTMQAGGLPNIATAPTSQQIQTMAQGRLVGAPYQSQTKAGEYTRTVGEFAPGLFMGPEGAAENMIGSAARKGAGRAANVLAASAAKNVLAPALASETAGQVTKGTRYEQGSRLAAALATGGATALTTGAPREARMVNDATRGVTAQQLADAVEGGRRDVAIGVPTTMAERVKTAAPHSTLTGTQKMIEASPQGAQLRARMAQRPAQVTQAGNAVLDQIAPAGRPDMVSTQAQAAADSALRGIEGERTAAASPFYQAASGQQVPAQDIQSLVDDLRAHARTDQTGLIGPRLEEMAQRFAPNGQPITDVGQLDTLRGHYRDLADLPPGTDGALDRRQSGAISPYLQRLSNEGRTGILDQNPNFVQGNQTYQDLSRTVVDPALAGPLGSIAGRGANSRPTIQAQGGALYPSAAPEGQAAVTAEAAQRMGDQGAPLTRAYLAQKLAEQTQSNIPGENEWGGAKFAADVAGNQNQRAALMAGVGQVAPQAQQPVDDLLSALQATGRRERVGSDTAGNIKADADVTGGGVGFHGLTPIGWAKGALTTASDATKSALGGARRQRLADMLQMPPEQWLAQIQNARDQVGQGNIPANLARALAAQSFNANTAYQNQGGQ